MDKTLNLKLKDFHKALQTLNEALEKKKDDIIRDSVIKRFEYAYELCWKTVKLFLRTNKGLDVFSPKDCFRELRNVEVVSDKETEILLQMVNDRNEIIHTYNEKYANELYNEISKKYYKLMRKISENLS